MERARALSILAGMLGVMALVPGLPTIPFLVLAVITGLLSYSLHRHGMPEPAHANAPSINGHTPTTSPAKADEAAKAPLQKLLIYLVRCFSIAVLSNCSSGFRYLLLYNLQKCLARIKMSSPRLRKRLPPQHAHAIGGSITTRPRGR